MFALLAGALVWRLSTGPISLDLIAPNINDALNQALGLQVEFDGASLRWLKETNSVDIAVQDARIFNSDKALIGEVPEMDLGFDLASVFRGYVLPARIDMVGAAAVVARRADGRLQMGFAIAPLSGQKDKNKTEEPPNLVAESGLSDYLLSLIMNPQDKSTIGQLTSIALRDASLAFYDEKSASLWQARNGVVLFRRTSEGVEARVQAQLVVEDGLVDLTLDGSYNRDSELAEVNAAFSEFMPSQLAAFSSRFKLLKRLEVPVMGRGSITVNRLGVVTKAAVTLLASGGMIDLDGVQIKKAGPPFRDSDPAWAKSGPYQALVVEPPPLKSIWINGAAFETSYDAHTGRIVIRQLSVAGPENWVNFTGSLSLPSVHKSVSAGAPSKTPLPDSRFYSLDLKSDGAGFYVPGIVGKPVIFDDLAFSVSWKPETQHLRLEDLSFAVDGGSGNLSGNVTNWTGEDGAFSPAVDLKGRIRNMSVETVIKLWPVFTGMGARGWLEKNLHNTVLTRGEFMMNAPAGVLGTGPLPNDALRFDFAFKGGQAHYIPGLTPARNIEGSATVYGNSLSLNINKGMIGNLKVSGGEMTIPRLSPKGSWAVYTADVSGDASEILELIDMQPLALTRKFGFDPGTIGGEANVHLVVRRPMWRRVPPKVVTYDIKATTHDFSLPNTIADLALTKGAFEVAINNKGIIGHGPFEWGDVPAMMDWREKLNTEDPLPTTYNITLDVEAAEYAKLGLDITGLARGPVRSVIRTTGKGANIIRADITTDLTDAVMSIAPFDWSKEAGQPASATFYFVPGKKGERGFKDLVLLGEGLEIRGDLDLAEDYSLLKAEFPVFKLGDHVDFKLNAARRGSNGGFVLVAHGKKLDVGAMVKEYFATPGGKSTTPTSIQGDIETLRLNEGVILKDAHFKFAGDGYRLTAFDVDGDYPDGGGLFAQLTGPSSGRRHLVLSSSDAGAAVRGIFGYRSLVGGTLELSAYYQPPNLSDKESKTPVVQVPAETEDDQIGGPELAIKDPPVLPEHAPDVIFGELDIENFKIVNLPIFAKLLSAGSFTGLSNLLSGDGLAFDSMEVPFVIDGGRMEFSQSRMAGSSMGVTMQGVYNTTDGTVDLDGTLAPAYALNSALGGIPLLGNLFVSRKGEGLLAFTYGISGPLDKARITVNPLSALAPGFLRRLFQFKKHSRKKPSVVENQPVEQDKK